MRLSRTGVRYGADNERFIPWHDPLYRPDFGTLALGWTAFTASALVGNVPGVVASTLVMEALRASRSGGAPEADLADTTEC